MDKIFFPININNDHWTLAVADMEEKVIRYYNSLTRRGTFYVDAILRFLADHALDKSVGDFDITQWRKVTYVDDAPQQDNGWDCGMFVILAASFLADGLPLVYHQGEIDEYRMKVAAAILRGYISY